MPWAIRPEGWEPIVVGLMMAFIVPLALGLVACFLVNRRRGKVEATMEKEVSVAKQDHYLQDETEKTAFAKLKAAGGKCGMRCEICCLSKKCMAVAGIFLVMFFVLLIWGLGFVREIVLNPDGSFFSSHLGMANIQPK